MQDAYPVFRNLAEALRDPKTSAYERSAGMSIFEHFDAESEAADQFSDAMESLSYAAYASLSADYDWKAVRRLVDIGGGRVCLDPRVLAKLIDALAIQPDDLVLDIGCGLGYSTAIIANIAEAVVALEEDEALAEEAAATLSAQGVDNAVVEKGPLVGGAPSHGPYDVIIIQGGIEALPDAIADQLRPDGRIAVIEMMGPLGVAQLGVKGANGISWRRSFDATAPILPGFAAEKAFVF
jgi:protein-L-isoaspartate(D-aspartate) O-methyltransferase